MNNRFVSTGDDIVFLSSCGKCIHKTLGAATCTAYPKGIPDPILTGKVSHKKPYPGDNGIRFEPIKKEK